MCHLATFRYGCGHWTLFQLHCEKGQAQLCEGADVRMVARYWARLRCLDCSEREWDRLDEERLATIDDRLADLARLSARGVVSESEHAVLMSGVVAKDAVLEEAAARAREAVRERVMGVGRAVGGHALSLLTLAPGRGLGGVGGKRGSELDKVGGGDSIGTAAKKMGVGEGVLKDGSLEVMVPGWLGATIVRMTVGEGEGVEERERVMEVREMESSVEECEGDDDFCWDDSEGVPGGFFDGDFGNGFEGDCQDDFEAFEDTAGALDAPEDAVRLLRVA